MMGTLDVVVVEAVVVGVSLSELVIVEVDVAVTEVVLDRVTDVVLDCVTEVVLD
jgi:hypothetical protein